MPEPARIIPIPCPFGNTGGRPSDARQFAPATRVVGLSADDPLSWPSSMFIAMDGYPRARGN